MKIRDIFKGLNWKFYFPFLLLFLGLSGFYKLVWFPKFLEIKYSNQIKQERNYLKAFSLTLAPHLITGDLARIHTDIDRIRKESRSSIDFVLYAPDGSRLYPIDDPRKYESGYIRLTQSISSKKRILGHIHMAVNINALIRDEIDRIKAMEITMLGFFLFFIAFGALLQHRWFRLPMDALRTAMNELVNGNYDKKLGKSQAGELVQLNQAFEKMRHLLKEREQNLVHQRRLDKLVREVQTNYISTQDRHLVFSRLLDGILELTGSKIGFIGELEYDQENFPQLQIYAISNIAWDVESRMQFERSIKGRMIFDNPETLFGQVMTSGQVVIDNDAAELKTHHGVPAGHQTIERFLGVPIYNRESIMVGVVAIANAATDYDDKKMHELNLLWLAIGNLIDHYRSQTSLKQSEESYRAVVENAIEAIVTIDNRGTILSFNPAAEHMFGYRASDILGENINTLAPESMAAHHDDYLDQYINGQSSRVIGKSRRELVAKRKNGNEFLIALSVSEIRINNETRFVGIIRDITERKRKEEELNNLKTELEAANERLSSMVSRDALTGIANRRHFDHVFGEEFRRARRQGHPLALILFDIDYFKNYNDHYGHTAGDEALVKVATAISGLFTRAGETVTRYGGEEFAIVLPQTAHYLVEKLAEVILETVRDLALPHARSESGEVLTVSVGAASLVPGREDSERNLFIATDRALYQAKKQGRNCAVVISNPGESPPLDELTAMRHKQKKNSP